MVSAVASVLAGAETSCGLLLAVAGAGKAYYAVRDRQTDSALRRALRVPPRRWRWVELATGGAECGTAIAVLFWPAIAGAVMALLGAAFCGLLGYVKKAGIPGGCNCLGPRRYAADDIGVREITRAAVLVVVGAAGAWGVTGNIGAFGTRIGFWGGLAVLGAVLTTLSMSPPRTRCGRPLLSTARGTLRTLAGHAVFRAMAGAAGPFAAEVRHRRAGCSDEFWFVPESGGSPVVFGVGYTGVGLSIRASRAAADSAMPPRRLVNPV